MRRYIPNDDGVFYYECECNPNTCLHVALIDWDKLDLTRFICKTKMQTA